MSIVRQDIRVWLSLKNSFSLYLSSSPKKSNTQTLGVVSCSLVVLGLTAASELACHHSSSSIQSEPASALTMIVLLVVVHRRRRRRGEQFSSFEISTPLSFVSLSPIVVGVNSDSESTKIKFSKVIPRGSSARSITKKHLSHFLPKRRHHQRVVKVKFRGLGFLCWGQKVFFSLCCDLVRVLPLQSQFSLERHRRLVVSYHPDLDGKGKGLVLIECFNWVVMGLVFWPF